jgi:hypothetical protein
VALPLSMVRKSKAFKDGRLVTAKGSMSGGMFGMEAKSYALRMDQFSLGELQLSNIPATSHTLNEDCLLIGTGLLAHFVVILNYPAEEMILRPCDKTFANNISSYGLAPTKKDKKTIVSGVWNNSSAAKHGIQPGDTLVTVNGVDAGRLSTIDLMAIFLDEKREFIDIEWIDNKERRHARLYKQMLLPF